jgi:hypothetical protein
VIFQLADCHWEKNQHDQHLGEVGMKILCEHAESAYLVYGRLIGTPALGREIERAKGCVQGLHWALCSTNR